MHARLCHEIGQDREREVAPQLVIIRVGEDRYSDSQLRQPLQVGQEPVATATVLQHVRPLIPHVPAGAGDTERVADRRARVRCRDRPLLLDRRPVEHDPTVERPSFCWRRRKRARSAALE